jgi:uncharacterized protein (TIGR02996 family)
VSVTVARRQSEREALLASVYEAPDDDAPRLVYADWLDEHGDEADRDRAAFIRAGCEAARAPFDSAERVSAEVRAAVLYNRHRRPVRTEWEQELPALLRKRFVSFRRGFPYSITTTAAQLARYANVLRQRSAVQEVNLEGMSAEKVAKLHGLPLLGRLRSLVGVNVDHPGPWCALLDDPALGVLERVSLYAYLGGRHPGLSSLLQRPALRRVRSLGYVGYYPATETAARRRTLENLARTEFPHLRSFRISLSDRIDADGLRVLLGAPFVPRLDELHLEGSLTAEAMELLSAAPGAGRLRALTVYTADHHALHLGAALAGLRLADLTWLQLNRGSDDVARRLAGCPLAPKLRVLDLFAHSLTAEGMAALASGRFAGLVWLGLWNGPLSEDRLRALASAPGLPELRYLDLHGPRLTQEWMDVLAASPHLPRLQAVSVGAYAPEPFPPEWVERYAHRFAVLPPPLGFLSSR